MHQHKLLLQVFLMRQMKDYRREHSITQEGMAERLRITPRSYAYLEKGTYGCSAATLMFFFLVLSDEDALRLRAEFRILIEEVEEHGVA